MCIRDRLSPSSLNAFGSNSGTQAFRIASVFAMIVLEVLPVQNRIGGLSGGVFYRWRERMRSSLPRLSFSFVRLSEASCWSRLIWSYSTTESRGAWKSLFTSWKRAFWQCSAFMESGICGSLVLWFSSALHVGLLLLRRQMYCLCHRSTLEWERIFGDVSKVCSRDIKRIFASPNSNYIHCVHYNVN